MAVSRGKKHVFVGITIAFPRIANIVIELFDKKTAAEDLSC